MTKPKQKRASASEKAQALEWLRQGVTLHEVARRLEMTPTTIARWRNAQSSDVAKRAEAIAPSFTVAPPADDAAPEPEPQTDLEFLRQLARDTRKRIREAERVGNLSAAQKDSRDLGNLLNTIARVEARERQEDDVLHLRTEELIQAKVAVLTRVRALASRPLLCAACSRELSVRWGREARAKQEGDDE